MVLAHELSHIQRHDWVVQVLADAARAIYWFNPVFWLASSRLRRESEHACDDAVVRLGAPGTAYAEELLAMTRALRSERLQSPILAMAQPSHLEQRLVALLNPSLNRLAATPWAVVVVTGVAIALTLPLAAVRTENQISAIAIPPAPTFTEPLRAEPATESPIAESVVRTSRSEPKTTLRRPTLEPIAAAASAAATEPPPAAKADVPPAPPFECRVTSSRFQRKVTSMQKEALGDGPWIINSDRTIWAADQPYVANTTVSTIWMRPANTELGITAKRLDGDAPELRVGPAAPYETGYVAIGVVFPEAGCWEVTATAGTSTLTFVTRVRE
jgi:hypothetical protein